MEKYLQGRINDNKKGKCFAGGSLLVPTLGGMEPRPRKSRGESLQGVVNYKGESSCRRLGGRVGQEPSSGDSH